MPELKRKQHEEFCVEYVKNGGNGTAAYRHAYPKAAYKTAVANSEKLLRRTDIVLRVDELKKSQPKPKSKVMSLDELREWVSGVLTGEIDIGAKSSDLLKAADLLGKMHGAFLQRTELSGDLHIEVTLSDDFESED